MDGLGERKAYQRQPARAVLLDLGPPLDRYTCYNIRDALSSTLAIIMQLHAVPCLSHFSVTLLGNYPKCLFPMQPVKGNTQRVNTFLKSLSQEIQSMSAMTLSSNDCIIGGLHEVIEQFQRVIQNTKQAFGIPSQVEITLVTGQSEQRCRDMMVRACEHINLDHMRKITAVCVSDPERVIRQNAGILESEEDTEEAKQSGLGASQMTTSQADLGMSMLDVMCTENDVLSLNNIFKQWLLDCSTDSEHLHLSLPGCLGDTPVTIKCDLQGRIIDPLSLPSIGDKFVLNPGNTPTTRTTGPKISTAAQYPPLPLYKLRAEALIEPEGVCESVLFGLPIMLRPTACWRLDWEELERNQQTFSALCRMLQQKGKYLLTMTEGSDLNPRFLILPSPAPSLSLMIKSIAVQELMMSCEAVSSDEQPSQETLNAVEYCLDTLELKSSYNPLRVESNLHHILTISSNKRGPLSKTPRAFSGGFQMQDTKSFAGGRDSRSLGPRKQYYNTRK